MSDQADLRQTAVTPLFQLILIILSASFISFAVYINISRYSFYDPPPSLGITTPEQLQQFGSSPDVVKVGLHIDEYQVFDIIDNEFTFTGTVWFEFNPGDVSLETLEKFKFNRGKIVHRSEPDTKVINGKLLVSYEVRVQFTNALDYRRFPLDDHRIYLTIVNPLVSPGEMNFTSSDREFVVKPEIKSLGWLNVDTDVQIGYVEAELDPYDQQKTNYHPAALFSIDYSRTSIRYALSILLPLALLFYLMMFSFSVDREYAVKLTVTGTTATLAYRFVIERISPEAAYFMLSDHLFFLFLTANFLVFFINVIDLFIVSIRKGQRRFLAVALHVVVCAACMYFIIGI